MIPTSWKEVNLKTLIKVLESTEMEFDTPKERMFYQFSIYTGTSVKEIKNMKVKEYHELCNTLSFIETQPETPMLKFFIINDVKYLTETARHNITLQELEDIMQLTKDQNNLYKHLDILLAIMYREVDETGKRIKTYDKDDVDNRIKIFNEHLNAQQVYSCVSFFLNLKLIYLTSIKGHSI